MPNDRAQSSILQNIDPKKYPKLSQFLVVQSLSKDKNQAKDTETKFLSNQQALELLEEAISEVEDQRSSPAASSLRASRQKELDQQAVLPVSELKIESKNVDNYLEKSSDQAPEQKNQPESAKSSESAELAELGQELAEIKEVDKEQEDKEMAKKQQETINQLANRAQTPAQTVKPVVVLPITEQQQKTAKKKSVYFSLRWLAEWAEKIKKIFAGAVLYKEEVENSADV